MDTSTGGPPAAEPAAGSRLVDFRRISRSGTSEIVRRAIAHEAPVALEYCGIGYAVLMATPVDLADLVVGFSLSERLIDRPADITDIDCFETGKGWIVRVALERHVSGRVLDRVRHRTSDSACGLCGIENLEQAMRPLPRVGSSSVADDAAIFKAYDQLRDHQPLNAATGAVHGAALCSADGGIRVVREDVGRHNAFDKLIGAMARAEFGWDDGFALLTSRASFELVEKAVLSNCPLLATISAPTGLALARAAASGLDLRVVVRADSYLAPCP